MEFLTDFGSGIAVGLGFIAGILLGGGVVALVLWRKIRRKLADLEKTYNEPVAAETSQKRRAGAAWGILADVRGDPGLTDEQSRDDGMGADGTDK